MKRLLSALLVLSSTLFLSTGAWAGHVYTYQGLPFTSVGGSAPTVTTSDSLSGFVEFATAPTANETGKTDWVAYELSDGFRTLSSASGDDQFFTADFFDFDSELNIVDWDFSIVPNGESGNGNVMQTGLTFDFSRLGSGSVQDARNGGGGTWTKHTTRAIPTLSTYSLVLTVLGLFAIAARRLSVRKAKEG